MILEIIFWLCLALVAYTYLGYPLLLALLTLGKKQKKRRSAHFPEVTLVISAHNEEHVIRRKLENSLHLNYPKDKLEIIVASDGSVDATNGIAKEYESYGVILLHQENRAGKTSVQNLAARKASGEIIVFSDANAIYDANSIRNLVHHFADENVGCVCGELRYSNNDGCAAGEQEDFYWTYEKFIKRQENRFGSILGANGSIYAVRKKDYQSLQPNIISDFVEPLKITASGKQVVYEPTAVSTEQSSVTFGEEFARKKRIILRSICSLYANRNLLNIFRHPRLAFQLISHKVIRWCVPLLVIGMIAANIALLPKAFFQILGLLHAAFYLVALLGFAFEKRKLNSTLFYAPLYFVMVNYAALVAIIQFLRGKNIVAWAPERHGAQQRAKELV